MNESLMPDWIKKKHDDKELAAAKENAEQQQAVAAGLFLHKECPQFWKQLQEKLSIAVTFLPKIEFAGSVSPFSAATLANPGMRVNVRQPGMFPNETYTDLNMHGSSQIHCTTMGDGSYNLKFGIERDARDRSLSKVVVYHDDGGTMDAAEASEYILRRMTDWLERERSRVY